MKRTEPQHKQNDQQNKQNDPTEKNQLEKKPNEGKAKRRQGKPEEKDQEKDMHPDHGEGCHGKDCVQEASEESFPASDPPSFTPTKGT